MSEAIDDYCVSCPKCGRIHQKSTLTDSIITCVRCSCQYRAYVRDGVVLEISMAHHGHERLYRQICKMISSMETQQTESTKTITDCGARGLAPV